MIHRRQKYTPLKVILRPIWQFSLGATYYREGGKGPQRPGKEGQQQDTVV